MDIKDLLIELIKIPSVSSDIDSLHEIIRFVENQFKDIENIYIRKFEFNNKPSIIISNFDGKYADIVLNGHLDVVPPSEENQFKPYEKDGKLYGRGAGDMKSGDAIIIVLMKNLLKNNFDKKKISLILTTDEEVGGFDGVEKLVELGYGGEFVIIPDSGNLTNIVHAEKGIIQLGVVFNGKSAHASRPWLGENAIDKLFRFYEILKNYIENSKKIYDSHGHRGSSVNLTYINGGIANNVIPDKVTANFDIRFTEEFNLADLMEIINNFLKTYDGKIENILVGDLLYSDPNHPYIRKYKSISEEILGVNINIGREHGGSDARFFSKKGSVIVLHRPTCGNLHTKKERVKIEDLNKIYQCYEGYILS